MEFSRFHAALRGFAGLSRLPLPKGLPMWSGLIIISLSLEHVNRFLSLEPLYCLAETTSRRPSSERQLYQNSILFRNCQHLFL